MVTSLWLIAVLALATADSAAATTPRRLRASGCQIGDLAFDGLAKYLTGQRREPGSIYADCINGKATCYKDDGISDIVDVEVPCASVEVNGRKLTTAKGCQIGEYSFDGLSHYLAGKRRQPGSIYADCIGGEAKCYVDDGISDVVDRETPCESVEIEERKRRLGVFMETDRAWPERVICYRWENEFTEKGKEIFAQAVKEYQDKVSIHFQDVNECKSTYGEDTKVCNNCQTSVAMKTSNPGCYANIGFIGGEYSPELNVGQGCEWYNTYLHEMGHVVGLFHEHAHPERGIVVLRDKLRVSSSNYGKDMNSKTLQYDMTSIMHYDGGDMCIPLDATVKYCDVTETEANGCVVPRQEHCNEARQEEFGKGQVLSEQDVAAINKMYEGVVPNPKSPGGSVTPAPPAPAETLAPVATETPAPSTRSNEDEDGGGTLTAINFDNIDSVLDKLSTLLGMKKE